MPPLQQSCCPTACNIINKEIQAQVFPYEFRKDQQNTFFTEHLWTTASLNSRFNKELSVSIHSWDTQYLFHMRLTKFLSFHAGYKCSHSK